MRLSHLLQRLRTGRVPAPPGHAVPAGPAMPATGTGQAAKALDRLDIQAAIILHLEWCVQFNEHLSGELAREGSRAELPDAGHCEFGRWLGGSAAGAPGQHPRFAELQATHERFHAIADEALRLAREDRMDLASTLLNTGFERERTLILAILRDMQRA